MLRKQKTKAEQDTKHKTAQAKNSKSRKAAKAKNHEKTKESKSRKTAKAEKQQKQNLTKMSKIVFNKQTLTKYPSPSNTQSDRAITINKHP